MQLRRACRATQFIFVCELGIASRAPMNARGVTVQNRYSKKITSSRYGLFSVGELAGSPGPGFLVKGGLQLLYTVISISLFQYKHLGFISHHVSLSAAFGCCAFLFLFISIAYGTTMHKLH